MLLALDRPAKALAEFERSLKRDPNRFRGLYGAVRAAEGAGNCEAARSVVACCPNLLLRQVPFCAI